MDLLVKFKIPKNPTSFFFIIIIMVLFYLFIQNYAVFKRDLK